MFGKSIKIDKADKIFSEYIREKANWKCENCHKDFKENRQRLQTSHYWGRINESTRFEPKNCMAFCSYCHSILGHGDGRDEYRRMMIEKLGEQGFNLLEVQKNTYCKKDREIQYLYWQQEYINICKQKNIIPRKI